MIAEQLQQVTASIMEACTKAGRPADSVQLIAVSKNHTRSKLQEAINAGHTAFGENRIQEAVPKIEALESPQNQQWHFLGHLQRNKAKLCVQHFDWIHSVDSARLIQALQNQAADFNKPIKALIQVNVNQEEAKSGITSWEELCELAEATLECSHVTLSGLMCIGAHGEGEHKNRQLFAQLREWKEKLAQQFSIEASCTELSMGMSEDYVWAIQEGATFIRIGRGIFGERIYQ